MKLLHYYLLGAVDQFGPFTSLSPAHQSQTELRNPPLFLWQSFKVDHRPQLDVGNMDKGQDMDVDGPWGGACAYSHSHSLSRPRVLKRYARTVSSVRTDTQRQKLSLILYWMQ